MAKILLIGSNEDREVLKELKIALQKEDFSVYVEHVETIQAAVQAEKIKETSCVIVIAPFEDVLEENIARNLFSLFSLLPYGIMKIVLCKHVSLLNVRAFFDFTDVAVWQVLINMKDNNVLRERIVPVLKGCISGAIQESFPLDFSAFPRPCIAITELGFCQRCASKVKQLLEEEGFHVVSFHAQGISDRAMDKLIERGYFDALIDICPAGLIEEVLNGTRAAGLERLDAPLRRGLPIVLAPCCLNITGCGPTRKDREKYLKRSKVWQVDHLRSYVRLNEEELHLCAELYANKLNQAKGPVKFVIPLKGFSSLDKPGMPLHDPKSDMVFIKKLRALVTNPLVEFVEVDMNLEDEEFATTLVENLKKLYYSTNYLKFTF